MNKFIKDFNEKYADSSIWQLIKFNLISFTITFVQLLLANVLPIFFDSLTAKIPLSINAIFAEETIKNIDSKYVVGGVLTWGYLLPFFLSNLIANIYGYFVNMKFTFKGKGTRKGMYVYCAVLFILIIVSTWLQSQITTFLNTSPLHALSRTIAASAAGLFQMLVIFPLEKYVLFKES